MRVRSSIALVAMLKFISVCPAFGQTPLEFYRGKTIVIDVGSAAGGAYDSYGRLVAAHLGQFIPGSPSVVVRNMPGAASMLVAQHIYDRSPQDGTELGLVLHTLPITQMMDPVKFPIRPDKFAWIGTVADPTNLLAVWYNAGVHSIEDAKKTPITIGATTPGEDIDMFPRIANSQLGTVFRIIDGYSGGVAIFLAMERGEVQGVGSNSWTSYNLQHPDWVRDGKVVPLFQSRFKRDPALPNVPTLIELAQTEEQRQVLTILTTADETGNPLIASPGVPAKRVATLRRGFDAMTADPAFLADARKAQLEVDPISGEKLQELVNRMMMSSPELVEKFKAAVSEHP
jgi:tripartite-type tricarboxylate transporter receptor subunit TctC